MPTAVIMRGIPGCGKSTWAKEAAKGYASHIICSADEYFMESTGVLDNGTPFMEYKFDIGQLPLAHNWCFQNFLAAIEMETQVVVVDNTNIRLWEFQNYIGVARMMKYDVKVVEVRVPGVSMALACCRRCSHGVPLAKIVAMEAAFEPYNGATIVPPQFSLADMRTYIHDLERLFPWRKFTEEEVYGWFPKEARAGE